jgi:ArsR family transcriptional regulator, arsenate/arsenite/antimonite-responsive transcriptional repressor
METKDAIRVLGALAQESRLEIFRLLVTAGPQGLAAGRIGEMLELAPATLSFHLKELANAGLVASRQEARFIFYSADYERMAGILAYLTQNCCQGMPANCVTTVETALVQCCGTAPERKSKRRKS